MTSKLKLKKVKHVKQLVAALVEEAYNGKPIHQQQAIVQLLRVWLSANEQEVNSTLEAKVKAIESMIN